MIRQFYTVGNTVAIGGRFLQENTMHLTEWTRLVACISSSDDQAARYATLRRNIYRIVLAIAARSPTNGTHYIRYCDM